MDLVSFIPGIGPTAPFNPGPNTPAPFNTAHTGATDGTSPQTSSSNVAELYNRLLLQVASVIVTAGLTVDNTNWTQLSAGVKAIATQAAAAATSSISTTYVKVAQYNSDFTANRTASGYQDLPGGLIIQWMNAAHNAGNTNYAFPIAFPSTCFVCTATGSDQFNIVNIQGLSRTAVNLWLGGDATNRFYAIAIGI